MLADEINKEVEKAIKLQMEWVISRIDKRISELERVNDLATQTITNAKLRTLIALRIDLTE